MKMWERDRETVNKWQAVLLTRAGLLIAIYGAIIAAIEIFNRPGTQYGLAIIGIGAGIMAGSDALASWETKTGRDK